MQLYINLHVQLVYQQPIHTVKYQYATGSSRCMSYGLMMKVAEFFKYVYLCMNKYLLKTSPNSLQTTEKAMCIRYAYQVHMQGLY